jgi:sugar phosphate isomerase/epimerase
MSHFTLGRHHPLDDRLRAAVAGGFDAIGLYTGTDIDLERLAELLDVHDLVLADIEVVRGWAGGPDADTAAQTEAIAWRLADRVGGRCLQAIGPYAGDVGDAARGFAALCDRAADHGLVVALEALPYTNIPTTSAAAEIVERAGRDNGGLCVDVWHHTRAGDDREALSALGGDRIMNVQLSDGPRRPPSDDLADYKDDCLRNRVPPGDGEMDVAGFVAAILDAGSTAPWSVEVCDDAVWDLSGVEQVSGVEHARRCGEATRDVLALARKETAR